MSMTPGPIELSVVIPVFNEEDNLEPLLKEFTPILGALGLPYEILCVDDKSTDNSLSILRGLQTRYAGLRVLCHTANYGESAAEATGFAHARGRLIVTMDADLQNDPADIPALLAPLQGETAAVCGVRSRREDNWIKRLSSRIANRVRNAITGDRISDAGCTFRALKREALREIPVFNGMHRFLPTLLRLQGYRVEEIPVHHRPRTRGQSKYGIGNRLWRGLADCLAIRWYKRRCVRSDRCEPERQIGE